MLEIDGRMGEGGGQVLRTALGLSLVTGRAFRIDGIRGGRRRPGLLRQHLTAVRVCAEIGAARVEGAELGSTTLTCEPTRLQPGRWTAEVGSAGSAGLVVQAALPGLLAATGSSVLEVTGGTHNRGAPPFEFLDLALWPVLRRMGAELSLEMTQPGFEPAGGGHYRLEVTGGQPLEPLELEDRGPLEAARAIVWLSRLPGHIVERETDELRRRLDGMELDVEVREVEASGPGNAVVMVLDFRHVTDVVTGFGVRGVPAERVVAGVIREVKRRLRSNAAVGPHLADQLLVPLAMAGGGSFTTLDPTTHSTTNARVIERFLDVRIEIDSLARELWRVTVERVC